MDCLRSAGVFRVMVSRELGEDELPPTDFLALVEQISVAAGSTGWVASLATTLLIVSALPTATLSVIFARTADIFFSGRLSTVPVTRVEIGLDASGRWTWASGCTGADYFALACKCRTAVAAKVVLRSR